MTVPSLQARGEGIVRLRRFQPVCRGNVSGWHCEVDGLRVQKLRSRALIRELLGSVILPVAALARAYLELHNNQPETEWQPELII